MKSTKSEAAAKSETITVHTSKAVKSRLQQLSKNTNRSCSYLFSEAIERYLSEEEDFIAAVREGLADGEAGRVYTANQVIASLTKRYQE